MDEHSSDAEIKTRGKLPRPLPFAMWNHTSRTVEIKTCAVLLLSMKAIDPFVMAGPAPIDGIMFTGSSEKLTKLFNLVNMGVPLEPIHICRVRPRKATQVESEFLGVNMLPERIAFDDGRHRYAFLRQHGWNSIFVCVPKREIVWFEKHIFDGPNPDCVLVGNPAE